MRAIDHGGALLTRAKIVLLFNGSGWINGVPQTKDVKSGLDAVLASPYPSFLAQYRGIRRPQIVQTLTDTTDFGTLGPDPRGFLKTNVWRITDAGIQTAVKNAMQQRPPLDGEDTCYMMVFSHDPVPIFADPGNLNAEGYHSQFDVDGRRIVYGVVLNWSANTEDNIWNSSGSLPAVFAHEVVEACTDPGGDGFLLDPATDAGNELADLADTRSSLKLPGLSRDISLACYWSDLNAMAVAPTSYSVRVTFGAKPSDSLALRSVLPKGSSVLGAILSKLNP